MPDTQAWLEQDEIAQMLDAPIWRVRQVVSALGMVGTIRTRPKRGDRRKTEVHPDDLPLVQRAIFGD